MSAASVLTWNSRKSRRLAVWMAQFAVIALSGLAAFLLRFDLVLPPASLSHMTVAVAVWLLVKTPVFHLARLDRGWWRYVSLGDVLTILLGNVIASAISVVVLVWFAPPGFPRSIYLIDLMLCFLGMVGLRALVRLSAEAGQANAGATDERTLIYGAGDAGVLLLRQIQKDPKLPYRVIGFLDDNPEKHETRILGIPVLGGGQDAPSVVERHNVTTILIAIPSATGVQMTRILRLCHAARVQCKTVRSFDELLQSKGLASNIHAVAIEDLLGRDPVTIEQDRIRLSLENRMVLITGAAGSIGSELCRQAARFSPAAIVGFDIAESPLFEIDREMKASFPNVPFHPEVGSIQNPVRLREVMERYRPAVIYHAAAYKHVPMMESCVFEAIQNNVLGGYNVAMAAVEAGVETFILISSDKAVRPTNIMGVTKRVAELMMTSFPGRGTTFAAVRFGNVLGSAGSVIPIFKRQIAAGGPVTVTHPEMRRYFMTIPEASQLVMQASAMAQHGQICVLDMGQPVKILDLARNLILLSGLRPGEDIPIEFSGIRPGEKLYEELNTVLEDTAPTTHSKIYIYTGPGLAADDILRSVSALEDICERRDLGELLLLLKELVPDYSPSSHILKRIVRFSPPVALKAGA